MYNDIWGKLLGKDILIIGKYICTLSLYVHNSLEYNWVAMTMASTKEENEDEQRTPNAITIASRSW